MSEIALMLEHSADQMVRRWAPFLAADAGRHEAIAGFRAAMVEAGLTLALVAEADGGLGLRLEDVAALPRLWGRHAVPLPVVEMLLGPLIASACGLDAEWAEASVGGARWDGTIQAAWWSGASRLLVIGSDDTITGYCVDPPETLAFDLAGAPILLLRGSHKSVESTLPQSLPSARLRSIAELLMAAAMIGAMEQARTISLDYARIRVQFGCPIGKFQAIQRLISEMASEVEVSRALLTEALRLFDAGASDALQIRLAKPRAAQAATIVAAHAHQILGAIGYTEEHELHRYTKRLWAWRDAWGRQAEQEASVGAEVIARGGHGLWPWLTGCPESGEET